MNRALTPAHILAVSAAALLLPAAPTLAQDAHAAHAHASHAAAPVAAQTPQSHEDHSAHAGHPAPPPSDPHAGHDMSAHAGHDMAAPAADPHAGHDMSAHAGHAMAAPATDPHAGHDMSAHAGHDMAAPAADPHAGHDMSAHAGHQAAAIPVSGPPVAAFSGPAHAADTVFGAEAMAGSRVQLLRENGDVRATALIIEHLEAQFGDGAETYSWDVQGWTGGDINRFWWKTEGEGDFDGRPHGVEVQALYSRAVAPFWDVQAGVRHDFNRGRDDTTHLVLGVQGVAPHWWEVDAAAFLSSEGDLTARVSAEYDQRITQKLILQPVFSLDLAASDNPEQETGSGLVSASAALRLRYEIRKEFAPYLGVEWRRSFGDTADYARARGDDADDLRLLVGVSAWF